MRTVLLLVIGIMLTVLSQASLAATQRLKVEGIWDGERFRVERVKVRDPAKNVSQIRVSGSVRRYSYENRRLEIGPVALNWTADQDADFSIIGLGDVLQVDALKNPFSAFTIVAWERTTVESAETIELVGAVSGSRAEEDQTVLFLAEIPTYTSRRLYHNGRLRLRRLDDKRPAEQWVLNIGSVRTTVGGELGLQSDVSGDRDFDNDTDDGEASLEGELQVEAFFEIGDSVSAFIELSSDVEQDYDLAANTDESNGRFRRGAAWIYVDRPFDLPVGLQLGRQTFAEDREWWWDEDLDALRIYVNRGSFDLEFAVAEELARTTLDSEDADASDADIFRFLANASFRLRSDMTFDLFYLHQNDHSSALEVQDVIANHREDDDDASLTWIGARLSGEYEIADLTETEYWIDVATMEGSETRYEFDDFDDRSVFVESVVEQERSGWAFDVGGVFVFPAARIGPLNEPGVTLGYAYGSGADSSDGTFRDTGLNDNNGKFNGVDRFRYYGELARPDLSNIQITTASLGFRLGSDSSVELIHHNYQQVRPSDQHSLRVDADSSGLSRKLGNEIDIVIGIEEWEHWEIELIGSYFLPGDAFDDDDPAWFAALKLNYNF